jgi:hypothetical protein
MFFLGEVVCSVPWHPTGTDIGGWSGAAAVETARFLAGLVDIFEDGAGRFVT